MKINNGTFIGDDAAVFNNNTTNETKLYIYDGVFSYTANSGNPYTFFYNGYNDGAEIYGGKYKGDCFTWSGAVLVYGGTFEQNPDGRVKIADGYEIVNNGNGTWTVKKSN